MKTIIQPEISRTNCDLCGCETTDISCNIEFDFGYESKLDGVFSKVETCRECAEMLFEEWTAKVHKRYITLKKTV